MIQYQYKEKQYNVPQSLSEVTIEMQIGAETLAKELPEDLKLMAIISAYTDIPIEAIRKGESKVFNEINTIMSFIYEEYQPDTIEEFIHNEKTYYIKPYIEKNEFQDWLSVQAILNNNKEMPIKGLARMIAVIAKQQGLTLDDIDLDVQEKEFMTLPMSIAKDIEAFFLSNQDVLRMHTLLSSKDLPKEFIMLRFAELKNITNKLKEQSGFFSLTRFQIFLFQTYMWFIKKRLAKYFSSTH